LPPGLADHPDYQVVRELGRGGMGVVYLARNRLMGRDEVLKVMSREIIEKPGVLDRFLREIRAVARLQHPNIVAAYSAFRLGESIVLAMEYVNGYDLSRLLKAKGSLSVAHAANIAYQAALGLQHAHEQGMVHRDIKPGNLMLCRQGDRAIVKILDFGLAKATKEQPLDQTLTQAGQMLGTPDYVAPEQTLDAQKADIRADIYSLGCTLYSLLKGGPPFSGSSLFEVLQAHHSIEAQPLHLLRPDVSLELSRVAARMMAKEPDARFQTPAEVAAALVPFFKATKTTTVVQPGGVPAEPTQTKTAFVDPGPQSIEPASPQTFAPVPAAAPSRRRVASRAEAEVDEATPAAAAGLSVLGRVPSWVWPAAAGAVLLLLSLAGWLAGLFSSKVEVGNIPSQALKAEAKSKTLDDSKRLTPPPVPSPEPAPAKRDVLITSREPDLRPLGQPSLVKDQGASAAITDAPILLPEPQPKSPASPDHTQAHSLSPGASASGLGRPEPLRGNKPGLGVGPHTPIGGSWRMTAPALSFTLAATDGRRPTGSFWPELSLEHSEEWTVGDPSAIKLTAKGVSLEQGPGGNFLLTRKSNWKRCTMSVTLAVTENTEAFLVLRAHRQADAWRGITSRITGSGGKVALGGLSTDFQVKERGRRSTEKPVNKTFVVRFTIDQREASRVLLGAQEMASENFAAELGRDDAGAAGLFVRRGRVLIESLSVVEK
jgi:hypothetical protein